VGNEIRTHILDLEGQQFAINLYPKFNKLAITQILCPLLKGCKLLVRCLW
jgi:hypothetical protein